MYNLESIVHTNVPMKEKRNQNRENVRNVGKSIIVRLPKLRGEVLRSALINALGKDLQSDERERLLASSGIGEEQTQYSVILYAREITGNAEIAGKTSVRKRVPYILLTSGVGHV